MTGFTTSFLTPTLLVNAGLKVLHASLSSELADGLENDTGRFQFFVLQKPAFHKEPSACGAVAAGEVPNKNQEVLVRRLDHGPLFLIAASSQVGSSGA